jgi:hypothetical protein
MTVLSSIALMLVAAFVLSLEPEADLVWRWRFIAALYGSICILGMAAVFFPTPCRNIVWPAGAGVGSRAPVLGADISQTTRILGVRFVHGHHPLCEGFRSHEVLIRGKSFCAGCTGLLIGAVIALIAVAASFFAGSASPIQCRAAVSLGAVGVVLGLFRSLPFGDGKGLSRVLAGAVFVPGTFLILWGSDVLLRSLCVDVAVVLFSLLWLGTRIELSRWSHEGICGGCRSSCGGEGLGRH